MPVPVVFDIASNPRSAANIPRCQHFLAQPAFRSRAIEALLTECLPENAVTARDRMGCDLGNGWADGSTVDRKGQAGNPDDVPDYHAVLAATSGFPWLAASGAALAGLFIGAAVMLFVRRKV